MPENGNWAAYLRDSRFRTIFLLGMASGLPSSLVFSTLSIWLREAGVSRTSIGLIGAVVTPYAINFLRRRWSTGSAFPCCTAGSASGDRGSCFAS